MDALVWKAWDARHREIDVARDLTLLNDSQWENIQSLLPPAGGFGRPRADDRLVLEGVLWMLRSGARWRDLPERYPSASTCWRRLRDWEEEYLAQHLEAVSLGVGRPEAAQLG